MALMVFTTYMKDWIHRNENNNIKGIMYVGFGVFCAIPIFHLIIKENYFQNSDNYSTSSSFIFYIFIGISYIGGLNIYLARIPEIYRPVKFDIFFHSH